MMTCKSKISNLMSLVGIIVAISAAPALAQSYIFHDQFAYSSQGDLSDVSDPDGAGPLPPVWPNDGCEEAKVSSDHSYTPNTYSAEQGKTTVPWGPIPIYYEWFDGVRHRHDLTAAELQNATIADPSANCVQGTDANPLEFQYYVDLNPIGWYRHNRFMEITCGTDRAPTPMNDVECDGPKYLRRLRMSGVGYEQIHGSIAVGVISLAADPCEADGQAQIYRLVVYDGSTWHELKNYPDPGTELHICKRWNLITLTIKTNTMDVRLRSNYNENALPGEDPCEGGSLDKTTTINRYYLGAFTSLVMGGVTDEEYGGQPNPDAEDWEPANYPNCFGTLSPNTSIPDPPGSYRDWIDDVRLAGGEALYKETPCVVPPAPGACCEQTGPGTGTCGEVLETECTSGQWLGVGSTCDQCVFPCADPFADGDEDGDVDQDDFAKFQQCYTGRPTMMSTRTTL